MGGKKGNRLLQYDLVEKSSCILRIEEGVTTNPSVSPDGKLIALTQTVEQGERGVVLIILDRNGKRIHYKRLNFLQTIELYCVHPPPAQLIWSPQQDKILVSTAGIYDWKAETLIPTNGLPITFEESIHNGKDCKGFLIVPFPNEQPSFVPSFDPSAIVNFRIVDWDGKEKEIELKTGKEIIAEANERRRKEFMDRPQTEKSPTFDYRLMFSPETLFFRWEGGTATANWGKHSLRIDPAQRQLFLEEKDPPLSKDRMVIQRAYKFASDGAVLRVIELAKTDGPGIQTRRFRIEVVKAGKHDPEVIIKEAHDFGLAPSPDGKLLAVRAWDKPSEPHRNEYGVIDETKATPSKIFIIDKAGVLIDTIETTNPKIHRGK
jgi:hypothetical protein